MKLIMQENLSLVVKSKGTWVAITLIIASALLNMFTTPALNNIQNIDGLSIFIFTNIQSNPIMAFIAPFLPSLVLYPFFNENLINGTFVSIPKTTSIKKNLSSHAFSSMIAGGSVFFIAYIIILLGCLALGSTDNLSSYNPLGLFKEVYYDSKLFYVILFILHSTFFGAIYALFSFGIAMITKKSSMGLVLPGILYHCAYQVAMIFNESILSWIAFLFPVLTYEFGSLDMPIWRNIADMIIVFVVSLILISISYKKMVIIKKIDNDVVKETK